MLDAEEEQPDLDQLTGRVRLSAPPLVSALVKFLFPLPLTDWMRSAPGRLPLVLASLLLVGPVIWATAAAQTPAAGMLQTERSTPTSLTVIWDDVAVATSYEIRWRSNSRPPKPRFEVVPSDLLERPATQGRPGSSRRSLHDPASPIHRPVSFDLLPDH